ncbi:hypothetical protein KEM52_004402 [Ascosphaera acerosa]|nr:hypothetical protein KEM52_004402 [Ascosphaera acerosa]
MPLTPAPAPASTTPAYASEHATPAQAQAQAQAQDYGPTSSNALSAARRRRPQLTIRTKRFSAEPSTTPASQAATPVAARHILGQLTNGSNSVTPRAKAADGRRRGMLVNGDGGATPRDSSSWPPATTTPAAMARSGPTTTPQHAASTTPVGNGYSVGPGMGGRGMHRRGGRGHSSLATVRFADDDSEEDSGDVEDDEDDVDPEAGSPSKGRSTLRSSITRHP